MRSLSTALTTNICKGKYNLPITSRAPDMLKEFSIPTYFSEDLFELMTEEERPDWR